MILGSYLHLLNTHFLQGLLLFYVNKILVRRFFVKNFMKKRRIILSAIDVNIRIFFNNYSFFHMQVSEE